MAFTDVILIVLVVGSLIFFAMDFKLGAVLSFFLSGACFIWFYSLYSAGDDVEYSKALILMFLYLVIMSLSLYASAKAGNTAAGGTI